ncbi:MAG: glycosyltransferase [Oscillospiraceae bacterium]|jgi:glycosyltransferase involved in cell wall biosynthesis|nr:glycosyltransferase [Oscillospiraceae bacterium]
MGDKKIEVSIILPIHNVEKYLNECLKTVENQTFKNAQVILINDCSTDSSEAIALDFVNRNSNFEYYKTEGNCGPAGARNFGITKAAGEYIVFADSDDLLAPDYIEVLYNTAISAQADIAIANYRIYKQEKDKYLKVWARKRKAGVYSSQKTCKALLHDFFVRSYPWCKIYRKSLFTANDITYPNMYLEDLATTVRLCYFANKVAVSDKVIYTYRVRDNSVMTTFDEGKMNDYMLAMGIVTRFLSDNAPSIIPYRIGIARFAVNVYFANTYYWVLHLHMSQKTAKGIMFNCANVLKTVCHYASKKHMRASGQVAVPYKILHPSKITEHKQMRKSNKANAKTGNKAKQELLLAEDDT